MIDLTPDEIAQTVAEAREELGLPPLPQRIGSFTLRPSLAYKPPDYFHVTQTYVTDDITGEKRAVLTWLSPSGEKRQYTEKVRALDPITSTFRYEA